MNRRERRWTERNQKKLIKKIQSDTLKQLNKDYPTDEAKRAYIEKLKQEMDNPYEVIEFQKPKEEN